MKKYTVNSLTFISRYFGVDINAIREYAKKYDDIQHLRAEIRFVINHDKIATILVMLWFSTLKVVYLCLSSLKRDGC